MDPVGLDGPRFDHKSHHPLYCLVAPINRASYPLACQAKVVVGLVSCDPSSHALGLSHRGAPIVLIFMEAAGRRANSHPIESLMTEAEVHMRSDRCHVSLLGD